MSLVCTMNGQCSGICGKASYQGKRLTLAEHERNGRLKEMMMIDDDDSGINSLG